MNKQTGYICRQMAKRFLIITLIITLLNAMALGVFAAEDNAGWESCDWETFRFSDVAPEDEDKFFEWLRTEGELETIFYLLTKSDGAYAESMAGVLYTRFREAPYEFVQELAKENDDIIGLVMSFVIYAGTYRPTELQELFESIVLPNSATDAERAIFACMIEDARENWGMELPNPKTGDPVVFIAAALVLSGVGGAVLLDKRKKEN